MNFKDIHIGEMIEKRVKELEIDSIRISNFFNMTSEEIKEMYKSIDLNSNLILKWSKLLDYDFFRAYSQHLILYSPPSAVLREKVKTNLPQFRKNIYTQEVIDFILELIKSGQKTKAQIIEEYNIPKTTLYKWLSKFQ